MKADILIEENNRIKEENKQLRDDLADADRGNELARLRMNEMRTDIERLDRSLLNAFQLVKNGKKISYLKFNDFKDLLANNIFDSTGDIKQVSNNLTEQYKHSESLLHILSQCRKYVDEARLRAEMEHDITNWPLYNEYSVYEEAKECEQLLKDIDKFLS